ncbi:MAG: OmpH family outer membrane protein [Syntrophobacteraceae bacterium]
MKRFLGNVLVAAAITLVFSVNAFAAGGGLKIGYFDLQAAITQSTTGKKFLDEMKKEEDRLGSELQDKARAFTTAKDEYEKKRDVMDEKTRVRKEKELTEMYTEVQKLRSDSTARFNEQATAARAPILKRVNEIATKIGKDDKYDFIFEKSALYYAGNLNDDLTKRISAELDKAPIR